MKMATRGLRWFPVISMFMWRSWGLAGMCVRCEAMQREYTATGRKATSGVRLETHFAGGYNGPRPVPLTGQADSDKDLDSFKR